MQGNDLDTPTSYSYFAHSTPVNVLIIVGSIPTLPPIFQKFYESKHNRGQKSNRWPTPEKYTHPLEDSTFDVYPLHERNTATKIVTTGEGEGLDEQVIGKPNVAGFSGHGEEERGGIRKTTDFDAQYEYR